MLSQTRHGSFLQDCCNTIELLQTDRWTGLISSCPSSVRTAAMRSQSATLSDTEPRGGGLAGKRGSQPDWLSDSRIYNFTERLQLCDNHDQRVQCNIYTGYSSPEQAVFDAILAMQPNNETELVIYGGRGGVLDLKCAFCLVPAHQRPIFLF